MAKVIHNNEVITYDSEERALLLIIRTINFTFAIHD
jgi:hypothetical protein